MTYSLWWFGFWVRRGKRVYKFQIGGEVFFSERHGIGYLWQYKLGPVRLSCLSAGMDKG